MPVSHLKEFTERRRRGNTRFPVEVEGPITIWPRFSDLLTGNQINIRVVLQGCFWNEDSIQVFQRTGQQTSNNVTLYIPYSKETTGRAYITPDEWNKLPLDQLELYWTADSKNLPLMIKGISEFEFQWAAPTASNRIAVQENNFMNANVGVRRARDINEQLFGTPDMWHVLIRS